MGEEEEEEEIFVLYKEQARNDAPNADSRNI